jgi:hypothetical protein
MFANENGFETLLNRVRDGESEPAKVRSRLEADLTPLVRRVLRTGYGPPSVVKWVSDVRSRLGETLNSLGFDHASRYLGRLLCNAVLERYTPKPSTPTIAAWETVAVAG